MKGQSLVKDESEEHMNPKAGTSVASAHWGSGHRAWAGSVHHSGLTAWPCAPEMGGEEAKAQLNLKEKSSGQRPKLS